MYKRLPQIKEALEELEARLKRERDAQLRPRLHLLVLVASGRAHTRQEASEHLALHRNTIGRWLAAYEQGGLDRLLTVEKTGAKPGQKTLPEPVWQALQARLNAEGFSDYKHVQRWLAEEWGLEIPYKTLHPLVRYRLGAKLKRARPVHAKKTRARPRTSLHA
jgi:transposase